MKMCGVAVPIMWSFSMEGNPWNRDFVIAVFMSMYPWSLISPGFVVIVIYRLFCFIFSVLCRLFVCFLVFHLILCYKVM